MRSVIWVPFVISGMEQPRTYTDIHVFWSQISLAVVRLATHMFCVMMMKMRTKTRMRIMVCEGTRARVYLCVSRSFHAYFHMNRIWSKCLLRFKSPFIHLFDSFRDNAECIHIHSNLTLCAHDISFRIQRIKWGAWLFLYVLRAFFHSFPLLWYAFLSYTNALANACVRVCVDVIFRTQKIFNLLQSAKSNFYFSTIFWLTCYGNVAVAAAAAITTTLWMDVGAALVL